MSLFKASHHGQYHLDQYQIMKSWSISSGSMSNHCQCKIMISAWSLVTRITVNTQTNHDQHHINLSQFNFAGRQFNLS